MKANAVSFRAVGVDAAFCVAGAILYSAAVNIFSVPNGIPQGGFTGVATLLNHLFPAMPVGTTILLLNLPVFALAAKTLGVGFILKTAIFTSVFSVAIDLGAFLPEYSGDRLLACLFCGVLSGSALALAFLRGATTGGTDLVAKLINLKTPHISVGRLILLADAVIIVASGFVYRSAENAMYSAIVVFVTSRLLDFVLYGAGHGRLLMIVTDKAKEITSAVTAGLSRGVTVLPVKGGYTGQDKSIVLCAVRANEEPKIQRLVREFDSGAFTVVLEAGEILGEGFKR